MKTYTPDESIDNMDVGEETQPVRHSPVDDRRFFEKIEEKTIDMRRQYHAFDYEVSRLHTTKFPEELEEGLEPRIFRTWHIWNSEVWYQGETSEKALCPDGRGVMYSMAGEN